MAAPNLLYGKTYGVNEGRFSWYKGVSPLLRNITPICMEQKNNYTHTKGRLYVTAHVGKKDFNFGLHKNH